MVKKSEPSLAEEQAEFDKAWDEGRISKEIKKWEDNKKEDEDKHRAAPTAEEKTGIARDIKVDKERLSEARREFEKVIGKHPNKKLRKSRAHRAEVRLIAGGMWCNKATATIKEVITSASVKNATKDRYTEKTLRTWVHDLAPNRKPGRRPGSRNKTKE